MRSGNHPKFVSGIGERLSRLARKTAHEWFRSDDPEAAGDGVEGAKITSVLYVTTAEGVRGRADARVCRSDRRAVHLAPAGLLGHPLQSIVGEVFE